MIARRREKGEMLREMDNLLPGDTIAGLNATEGV